jgi:hypothetical protein
MNQGRSPPVGVRVVVIRIENLREVPSGHVTVKLAKVGQWPHSRCRLDALRVVLLSAKSRVLVRGRPRSDILP